MGEREEGNKTGRQYKGTDDEFWFRACQYADLPDVVLLGDLRRPGLGDVLDRVETAPILQVAAAAVLPRLAEIVVFRQCLVFSVQYAFFWAFRAQLCCAARNAVRVHTAYRV